MSEHLGICPDCMNENPMATQHQAIPLGSRCVRHGGALWTDQEKAELLDFLRRFVVPLLREPHRFDAVAIEDRLANDFPALRLLDPPRAR